MNYYIHENRRERAAGAKFYLQGLLLILSPGTIYEQKIF